MFGTAKLVMVGLMVTSLAGGVAYMYKLKADNAILKENAIKLEEAVSSQQAVIQQQTKDFNTILTQNKKMTALNETLNKELSALDDKFNKTNGSGQKRDIGDLAIARTKTIEKVINKARPNKKNNILENSCFLFMFKKQMILASGIQLANKVAKGF